MPFPTPPFGFLQPVPGTPTGLSVVPTTGSEDTSLTLTWSHPDPFAKHVWIQRSSVGSTGPWTDVQTRWTGGSPYVDTSRAENSTYWYRVHAGNYAHPVMAGYASGNGTTDYEHITTAPSWWSGYPKPDLTDYDSILLRLQNITQTFTLYRVYWKLNGALNGSGYTAPTNHDGSFTLAAPTTEHDHEGGFGEEDVVHYQVRAENPSSTGLLSGDVSATIPIQAPAPPTGITASLVGGYLGDIQISWTDASDNEDGFYLEHKARSCDGSWPGSWTSITPSHGVNDTSYDWPSGEEGKEYLFRVCAHNGAGSSAWNEMVEPNQVAYAWQPSAVASLAAAVDSGNPTEDVDITWDESGITETFDWVSIHRGSTSGFTPSGANEVTDSPQATGVELAQDDGLGAAPSGGGVDSVTPVGYDTMRVDINPYTDATSYILERAPDVSGSEGTYGVVASGLDPGDFPYDDDTCSGGTKYWYRIKATAPGETFYYKAISGNNCGQESSPAGPASVTLDSSQVTSSGVSGTTWPAAPTSFVGDLNSVNCPTERADLDWANGGNTTSQLTLRWTALDPTDPSFDPYTDWTVLSTTISAGSTYYLHTTPVGGYNWWELKFNSGGDGSWVREYALLVCPE